MFTEIAFLLMVIGILSALYLYFQKDVLLKARPKDISEDTVTASETLLEMLKDPLVTSRAYFTEPATGPIGDFVGYSPVSQDNWLHSLPHEKSQNEGSKYDKIRSFI